MSITSPEPGFTPRREFVRDHQATPNSFSLLAISGGNCIRLYSFPLPLMTALQRLLDQQDLVTAFREDTAQQLCEIALVGKPWTSAKSLSTEKLLLELLSVIYQHGYTYLSTIDYGRESDDRLAMAFSKPAVRSLSPLSPGDSPLPASLALTVKRVPFALSFTSATMMRVIAPPLHSTPAILQAVRGAWPRGVVSEKKVGGNCFEFKLKGYKWFHEDTFATDSLRHILSLLSSLDAHSFSLLTSISLTSRSRVKDLWIFTGPAASSMDLFESPEPSILNSSHAELRRAVPGSDPSSQSQHSLHRRLASEPSAHAVMHHSHARAATDSPAGAGVRSPQPSSNLLRKAAPRAQVPVSVYDSEAPPHEMVRANLPSVVSPSLQDFTGVGAADRTPNVLYSTPPYGHNHHTETSFPLMLPIGDGPDRPAHSPTPSSPGSSMMGRASPHTAPALEAHPPSHTPRHDTPPLDPSSDEPFAAHSDISAPSTPPLLGYGAFAVQSDPSTPGTPSLLGPDAFRDSTLRDSTFSSATDSTYDVPVAIKWTGAARHSLETRDSTGPTLPGGWQPTPIEEKPEDTGAFGEPITLEQDNGPTPQVQEVVHRVASPDLQVGDFAMRKSEAGMVGLIAASENQEPEPSEGKGWVVVDIEGQGTGTGAEGQGEISQETGMPLAASPPASPASPVKSPSSVQSPVAPAAKAIAAVDAIEAKNKSGSKSKSPSNGTPHSLRRKLFSLTRKNSNPPPPSVSAQSSISERQEEGTASPASDAQVTEEDTKRAIELVHNASSQEKTKPRAEKEKPAPTSRLRDKLRLIGTPEASRNEDKRRSIT
ncbi:hypothetical protein B0H15DRAFT_898282 [Mycena belliarum]|uniref:Uncharacterized protein n=1 Tax=Mycena belliarum TaxID=1033014 RepID=A0AAD6UFV5_9AGAR|nr:hypothetical protein B0H15DRAFT_898282 [Mycena belliae]